MTIRRKILAGVALIVVGCLALSFGVIYRQTTSSVRAAIDDDLQGDMAPLSRSISSSRDPVAAARRYVAGQPFRATTRLLFVVVPGRQPVTNEPDLLGTADGDAAAARTREARLVRAALVAPPGLHTLRFPDVGRIRLLVRVRDGVRFGVGEPLENLRRTERGVRQAFLVAGAIGIVVALVAGAALSLEAIAPLRRMAAVADRIGEGDLEPRMDASGPRDEVRALAVAFDTMLDRLQDAFDRQAAFVADASHELRTPLTVVRGQLEVLARDPDPPLEDVRHVERLVLVEVERMTRMVDDLLLLAAPAVHPAALEVGRLLRELLESQRPTAERSFELGPVPAISIQADGDRLAQAVRNLLRNAVQHTVPGGRIRLSAAIAGTVVRISAEDDGPGIAPDERERVFDRFHRSASGARRSEGTGLGLAIVRSIAEAHGGRAFAAESPLGGACVSIELPLGPSRV